MKKVGYLLSKSYGVIAVCTSAGCSAPSHRVYVRGYDGLVQYDPIEIRDGFEFHTIDGYVSTPWAWELKTMRRLQEIKISVTASQIGLPEATALLNRQQANVSLKRKGIDFSTVINGSWYMADEVPASDSFSDIFENEWISTMPTLPLIDIVAENASLLDVIEDIINQVHQQAPFKFFVDVGRDCVRFRLLDYSGAGSLSDNRYIKIRKSK